MAVVAMDAGNNLPGLASIWTKKLTIVGAGSSDIVIMPETRLSSLDFSFTGSPTLWATISSRTEIDAGTADWQEVGQGDTIGVAATAIKATNATGTAVINLIAKTY